MGGREAIRATKSKEACGTAPQRVYSRQPGVRITVPSLHKIRPTRTPPELSPSNTNFISSPQCLGSYENDNTKLSNKRPQLTLGAQKTSVFCGNTQQISTPIGAEKMWVRGSGFGITKISLVHCGVVHNRERNSHSPRCRS